MVTIEDVAISLVRLESKIDRMDDRIGHLVERDHGHESPIRALESKPVVTIKAMATGVLIATALASIIPVINLIRIGDN